MSLVIRSAAMPHWAYEVARYWVRTQLAIASGLVMGLTSISLGLNPIPKTIPLRDLINRYPGPAFGLGCALVVVSAFAFVLARRPEARETAGELDGAVAAPLHSGGTTAPASPQPAPSASSAQAQAQVPARPRRWGIVGMVALLLLSLVILGTGGALAYTSTQGLLQEPAQIVVEYCSDVLHANPASPADAHYANAFHLLSIAAQHRLGDSISNFQHLSHLSDIVDGSVQQCSMPNNSAGVVVENNTAHAPLRIVRAHSYSGTVHLVYEQKAWRIDHFDAALEGTDVAPLAAAEDMCGAFVARNFGTAYGDLSASEQQQFVSVDDLALVALSGIGGQNMDATFYQCAAEYSTYTAPAPGTSPSVVLSMTVRTVGTGPLSGTCVDDTFDWTSTLVQVNGEWKIDQLDFGTDPTSETNCAQTTS